MVKFGVYDDDLPVFDWLRRGVDGTRKCLEAQVMDLADDVAYSVHDVEDGIVADRLDLTRLDLDALWETVRAWYLPDSDDAELLGALESMRAQESWPRSPYDGSRRSLAAIKNLTSDLVGRFCGSVQAATFAASDGPFVRHRADLVVPRAPRSRSASSRAIAAHYVMQAQDRVDLMERQRQLMSELFEALWRLGMDGLDPSFVEDWQVAADDARTTSCDRRPGRVLHGRASDQPPPRADEQRLIEQVRADCPAGTGCPGVRRCPG